MPGFIVPMSAVLLTAGLLRDRGSRRWPTGDALVGPAVLAAIFMAAVIGPFVADSPSESSLAVAALVQHLLLAAAVFANARRPEAIKAALAGLATGGALLATITNLQTATGTRSSTFGGFGAWTMHEFFDAGVVPRAVGPFIDDPNSYAQYLTISVMAATGLAFVASRRQDRLQWALAAGWITIALLLTRSRSGLISLILIGAAALVVNRRAKYVIGAVVAVGALLVLTPLEQFSRLETLTSSAAAGPSAAADTSVRGRTSEARAALEMFLDRPLTGVGLGGYPSEYLEHARWIGLDTRFEERSAHSYPLEIAAEQGLIGLAAWAALIVFTVATLRALRRRRPDAALPLTLALAALAASSLFLHDVYPQAMWLLIGLVLGASIWLQPARAPVAPPPVRRLVPERERLLVAMVIQNYVPALGGAERQLANLVPLMARRGIEPVIVTRHCPGRPRHDEIAGIRVLRVPTRGPKPLRSAIFIVGALFHLSRLRPDVVHAFDTLSPSTIALAHRRRFGTPVAVKLLRSGSLGDLDRLARARGGARRLRRLLAEVDMFVAISTDIDNELARRGVEPARRIFVPNGVDARRFHPPPRRPRHRRGGPVVIATGRLAPEKRLVELADRWARVRQKHPTARLVVVGEGSQRPLLEGRDGIELLGQVDDVAAALRRADVYVSASAAEGLSNSLLEAMASGLACVVTDVGGVRDVIKNDAQGVVVPPDDLDQLVDQVIALLDDHERRHRSGVAGRTRVTSGWALTTTAGRLIALYRRLGTPGPVIPARVEPTTVMVTE
jgi:glycosyltransferase involved in cell wall biosynthesis/O-antigen ligase